MTKMTYHQREYAEFMANFMSSQLSSTQMNEKPIIKYMDCVLQNFDGSVSEVCKFRRLRSLII